MAENWWEAAPVVGGSAPVRGGASGKGMPKLSAPLQRDELDDVAAIRSAVGMNGMLDRTRGQLSEDDLQLGPLKNVISQARNAVGMSDGVSRNFASFRATLEKLRNDSLRLNKGVQTEGDAQRAWNEMFTNLNDEKLVEQRLNEVAAINQRAIADRQMAIDTRRVGQNVPQTDTNVFAMGSRSRPVDLSAGQSRAGLAPGTYYKDPYGNLRRNDNGDAGNPKIEARTGVQIKDEPGQRRPSGKTGPATKTGGRVPLDQILFGG